MNKQCTRCSKTVYPPEELSCLDKIWHKACFKCWDCGMALNVKTYKGFGKFPYCESHVPKPKATTMTGTPEMQRLAENTKIQSNVKYHADFERSKGKYTTVADDPETIRIKEASRIISNVSYHGDLLKKAEMESRRALTKDDDVGSDDASIRVVASDPHPVASKSSKGPGATFGQPSARSVLVTGASGRGYRQREQGQPSAAEQNMAAKQFLTPQQQRYEPQPAGQGLAKGTSSAKPPANLGRCYRAIYDYVAADTDEVAFKDGDLIINCSPIDEGWMTGTVQRTMRTGMLPANYVEPAN